MAEETYSVNSPTNKRMYKRYIVNLKGRCCDSQKNCNSVEIRDFCLGGMYLVYEATEDLGLTSHHPQVGDVIDVLFNLPVKPVKKIHFRARVVRSDLNSLGISFLDPSREFLQYSIKYAKWYQARHEVNLEVEKSKKHVHTREEILETIHNKTSNPITVLVDTYLLRQNNTLMEMADKSDNISDQNVFFEAMEAFDKKRAYFRETFIRTMSGIVTSEPEVMIEEGADDGGLSAAGLSLVEEDAIDDWIARSDITAKSESFFHDELISLEKRLSIVYGMTIGKENNPIGPAAFSRAFQETIKTLGVGKRAYLVCCKIFRDVLKDGLGSLYEDVNKYLINNDVMAEVHYEIKKAADEGVAPSNKNIQLPDTTVAPPTQVPVANTGVDQVSVQASQAMEPPAYGNVDNNNGRNLYELISSLQSFKPRGSQPVNTGEYAGSVSDLPPLNNDELVGMLSNLVRENIPPHIPAVQGDGSENIESLTLQMLHKLQESPEGQRIAPREEGIMETTGSIYQSLYDDKLITHGVKDWLSNVELPLLKEAIKDESVLADRGHIARQFVNHLSKLELYNDESKDLISNSVKKTIEDLLQQVSEQPGMDEQLIRSLLRKVDALINTQNKAYNENLHDVVEQCNSHQPLPSISLSSPAPAELSSVGSEKLHEWRKRIRRLKIGDWILFNAGSAESNRLRLTWISDNYDQYVFVNLRGLMEGEIGVDELAYQMTSGNALFLDNVEEPAVDRAQYSMLQNMHTQLLHETTHDQLTGLMNRREFEKQLKLNLVSNEDHSNVICFFDIDYFEVINSTFGYEAGDKVLVDVSKIFSDVIGERGILARVGGNEFAVLLCKCSLRESLSLTSECRKAFSEYRFIYDESSNTITFSAGVVPIDFQQHEIGRLLQTADAACRLAKSKGISQEYVIDVDSQDLQENKKILYWASQIDDSMSNDRLQLRYQPITPINDDSLEPHVEILIGVSDEQGQLASPEHFIMAAERYKRMPDVDRWVIRNVFNYFNQHKDVLDKMGGIAINLSGLSINDDTFIAFIIEQLGRVDIPHSRICFEVTETAGIDNLSNAAEFISEIKQTGCLFSLDDFGTGMSSYSYLKNLPVDFIKIDGCFVRDIEESDSDKAVVKSVTEIGHFLGKKIIAECVEKESTIGVLRDIGVDYVQGYAISKPKVLMPH